MSQLIRTGIMALISLFGSIAFSIDLTDCVYDGGTQGVMSFDNNNVLYFFSFIDEAEQEKETILRKNYSLTNNSGLTYLVFDNERWLVLYNEFILHVINEQPSIFFRGIKGSPVSFFNLDNSDFIKEVSASSYLTEILKNGTKAEYLPENLLTIKNGKPWVENVDGWGEGEKIIFSLSDLSNRVGLYRAVWFYNGFVDYNRPELYIMNGRVKKIKVTGISTGKEKYVNLEDSPNPQVFTVHYHEFGNEIEIEIIETYHGTRFQDTCINYINISIYDENEDSYGIVRRTRSIEIDDKSRDY